MSASALALLQRRREMMVDSNIIYKASNIVFDGTNYINTGIQLMSGYDWFLEMSLQVGHNPNSNDRFLHCRNFSEPLRGIDVRGTSARDIALVIENPNYNIGKYYAGDICEFTAWRIGNKQYVKSQNINSYRGLNGNINKPLIIGAALNDDLETYRFETKFKLLQLIITKL